MSIPSFLWLRIEEKNDVFVKGGCVLDEDGWEIAAVFDFNDGDDDVRPGRLDLFGLVTELSIEEERFEEFIFSMVTFLFFLEGEDIVVRRLLCKGQQL